MSNNDSTVFSQFAKGKIAEKARNTSCVIYTRVSTKEQADNNMSLDTQKNACESYAQKNGYQIMGYFGGTYESAKTDERKQFNNMLSFVKKSGNKISTIIVYSVDRFSRSGANAIYITEQLRREGITVFAVTQPNDATTATGILQQNIQFIFSEYDNQLRRQKCMAGMKEQFKAGVWCVRPPIGYDIVKSNGKKSFVLNYKGKLIRRAFGWKLQGLNNEDIRVKLADAGWNVGHQRISDFLSNPFYCGLVVHTFLEGEVVEGIQEKAVTREMFLKVNNILAQTTQGYSIQIENEDAPLKRFISCDSCGKLMRAYMSKKIKKYYYKCNTKGCSCNKRADELHERFQAFLNTLTVNANESMLTLMREELIAQYHDSDKESYELQAGFTAQLNEVKKKIARLEERFINEDIDKELYLRYKEKFAEERDDITRQSALSENKVSNLEKVIEDAIIYSLKLAPAWAFGDYNEKQLIQKMVFPEGFYYNRKIDQCRTPRINSVFSYIAELARVSPNEKPGNLTINKSSAGLVVWAGIEPATHGFSVHCSTD